MATETIPEDLFQAVYKAREVADSVNFDWTKEFGTFFGWDYISSSEDFLWLLYNYEFIKCMAKYLGISWKKLVVDIVQSKEGFLYLKKLLDNH